MKIIKFCQNNCCPVVILEEKTVLLGDANGPEGVTKWTQEQFKQFIEAAKKGDFDEIVDESSK